MNNMPEIKTKVCSKCLLDKPVTEFHKRLDGNIGYKSSCKECIKEYNKRYAINNKEVIKKRKKPYNNKYRQENKEKLSKYNKEYRLENRCSIKERNRLYHQKNKKVLNENKKQYRLKNKDRIRETYRRYTQENREKINERYNDRKKIDLNFKIRCSLSTMILKAVKTQRTTKSKRTKELIGCSIDDYRKHFESQFKEGMSWDNHGEWHVDHIIDVSNFPIDTHPSIVNNLSNLRPLWSIILAIQSSSHYVGCLRP